MVAASPWGQYVRRRTLTRRISTFFSDILTGCDTRTRLGSFEQMTDLRQDPFNEYVISSDAG